MISNLCSSENAPACSVSSGVVQCCGLVSVFYVVKWVTWHCTPPWMPASKPKKKKTMAANKVSKQKAIVSFCRDDSETVSFGLSYNLRQIMNILKTSLTV